MYYISLDSELLELYDITVNQYEKSLM